MAVSREVELERQVERLKVQVEQLMLENLRLVAKVSLLREELQWADEKRSGYDRVWTRIRTRIQHLL